MHEKQVEALVENLERGKQYLLKAKVRTPSTVAQWLEGTAVPYLRRQAKELEGDYKKAIGVLLNGTQTLLEGLLSGDADLDDAIDLGRDYRGTVTLIESYKDAEDKSKSKEELQKDKDWGRDGLVTMTRESEPVIRKYSIYKDDLPGSLFSRPFVIQRMPIIPLSDPPLNFEKLKAAKISTDHIGFYPILLNQPLLGLNFNWVLKEFRGKTDKAVKYVLDAAYDKFQKTYHPTGLPVHHGKVVWIWIPANRDVAKIQGASPVGRVAIKKWGFPFQS